MIYTSLSPCLRHKNLNFAYSSRCGNSSICRLHSPHCRQKKQALHTRGDHARSTQTRPQSPRDWQVSDGLVGLPVQRHSIVQLTPIRSLECRTRRIKCDESKPACTQCRRTHRSCSILESVFRPSSYTSLAVHESEACTSDATEPPSLRSGLEYRLDSNQDRLESFGGPATAEAVAQSEDIDHGFAANSDLAAFEQALENDPCNMDHGDHAHTSHSQATEGMH